MELSKEQLKVKKCNDRVISLRGPHGTGKTETVMESIAERVRDEACHGILAVTLTKSAAFNLKDRLEDDHPWIKTSTIPLKIGTSHSFAFGYVAQHSETIGFQSKFAIDRNINDKLLTRAIHENHLTSVADPLKTLKGAMQTHVRSGRKLRKIAESQLEDVDTAVRILKRLKKQKRMLNIMDFDDILYYFYRLLKKDSSVVRSILQKYSWLVVDEFQDTTNIQWKIMTMLIDNGICFLGAGDPFQTLFRFAGASLGRFDQLEALPGCRRFHLTENHRTTQEIIAVSNSVLRQYQNGDRVKIWSNENGPKPQVILSHSKGLLCKAVLEKIRLHMEHDKLSLKDMAITFRHDKDANYPRKLLEKQKIPYIMYSRESKTEPDFIKFARAILEISQKSCQPDQWLTILSRLGGVGQNNIKKLLNLIEQDNFHYRVLRKVTGGWYKKDIKRLHNLFLKIALLKKNPTKAIKLTLKFVASLRKKIDGIEMFSGTLISTAQKSVDIIDLMINMDDTSFGRYHISRNYDDPDDVLTLANIHQIKGKEFKVVFILGSYDKIFESLETFENDEEITDEIFLMNTAMTRSSRYLYFLFPMLYKDWKDKAHPNNPSIFIRRSPQKLFDVFTVNQIQLGSA